MIHTDIYSDEDLVKSTKQFSAFNRENPNRANVKLEEKVKDLTENLDSAYALTGQPICSSTSNMFNHTPLTVAIRWDGDLAMIKLLINAGADKDKAGYQNKTPLEWAREKGKSDIVKYLQNL